MKKFFVYVMIVLGTAAMVPVGAYGGSSTGAAADSGVSGAESEWFDGWDCCRKGTDCAVVTPKMAAF